MDNINIRKAEIGDIKNITPVHLRAWKYAYDGIMDADFLDKKTSPENYSARIDKSEQSFIKNPVDIFLVAEVNDKIVGFVFGGNPKSAPEADKEIFGLYVDPDLHKQGIGKKLFAAFVEIVKADGIKTIGIGCLKDNKSVGFYKKMGGNFLREGFWEYEKGKIPELFFVFEV